MSASTVNSSSSPVVSPSVFAPCQPSPRASFTPSQLASLARRPSPHLHPSHSPRGAFDAPSLASAFQQPKHYPVQSGLVVGSFGGYVHAGTQYSPDGFPPTAGRRLAARTGKPPGSKAGSSSRKRKEIGAVASALEPMSDNGASSGAPQRDKLQQEDQHPDHCLKSSPPSQQPQPQHAEHKAGSDPSCAVPHPVSSDPQSELQEARSTHGHSAAPKRLRPEGSLKMMPLNYEDCNPKDLGVLIANMLMELIRINDRIPLRDGRLTRFHSRAPPGISVSDYLQRLIQHATLYPPIMLSMVYYIDRLCTLYPAFTINSLTVHRFLITAATVAAKGLSDSFWTNPTYARIGGIPVSELATLELEFLQRVEWKIVPKPEVLVEYYQSLVKRTDGFQIEAAAPTSICASMSSPSLPESDPSAKNADENTQAKREDRRMEDGEG